MTTTFRTAALGLYRDICPEPNEQVVRLLETTTAETLEQAAELSKGIIEEAALRLPQQSYDLAGPYGASIFRHARGVTLSCGCQHPPAGVAGSCKHLAAIALRELKAISDIKARWELSKNTLPRSITAGFEAAVA